MLAYSLPEWQSVKLTFFSPWARQMGYNHQVTILICAELKWSSHFSFPCHDILFRDWQFLVEQLFRKNEVAQKS